MVLLYNFCFCWTIFSFVSSRLVIAQWSLFVIHDLKSLSDNANLCLIWGLVSVDYLVSFQLRFFWFLVMSDFLLKSGYFGYYVMRIWICFSRPVRGKGELPHYCQFKVETQVLSSAFIDSQSKKVERHLDTTRWGWEFRLLNRPLLIPPWCCIFFRAQKTRASQPFLQHLSETSYVYIMSRISSCILQEG